MYVILCNHELPESRSYLISGDQLLPIHEKKQSGHETILPLLVYL